jgi:hypothetical protein
MKKSLVEFLDIMLKAKVHAAVNPNTENENVTLVGDWFAGESVATIPKRGVRQTNFTRHAPSIQNRIEAFDEEFIHLFQSLN